MKHYSPLHCLISVSSGLLWALHIQTHSFLELQFIACWTNCLLCRSFPGLQGLCCTGAMGNIFSWREIARSGSRIYFQISKQTWAAVDNQVKRNQWLKVCSCGDSDLYWLRWKLSLSPSFIKLLMLLVSSLAKIFISLKKHKDIFPVRSNRFEALCLSKTTRNTYKRKNVLFFFFLKVLSEAQSIARPSECESFHKEKRVFQESIPSPTLSHFSCCQNTGILFIFINTPTTSDSWLSCVPGTCSSYGTDSSSQIPETETFNNGF